MIKPIGVLKGFGVGNNQALCLESAQEIVQQLNEVIEHINEAERDKEETVKHGHWIEHMEFDYEGGYSGSSYSCSNCHESNYYDDIKEFNYCPCCGAKMDGVNNG